MDLEEGKYKVEIDGDWDINDLYIFSKNYEQVYYALFSLYTHNEETERRIRGAYAGLPWQGGYSAVNFYEQLKYTTPHKNRPKIITMQYASPGWFELSMIIGVAVSIKQVVGAITFSLKEINSTYHRIYSDAKDRKLLRIKADQAVRNEDEKKKYFNQAFSEIENKNIDFIRKEVAVLASILKINDVESLHKKTGSPLRTLKILLSLYRRIRKLAEMEKDGKTRL